MPRAALWWPGLGRWTLTPATALRIRLNDPSGKFEVVGNELRVKAGATIDYETAASHDLMA